MPKCLQNSEESEVGKVPLIDLDRSDMPSHNRSTVSKEVFNFPQGHDW